ncbi:Arm DNA-binding domain-containing protein [uncultured Alistipes sp.]|uniref:Arm DNA-binding domain-containing protein n=1 Tax=uncultured Alistipes sp. TaxID=538949 RepID=UPI00321FFF7E
MCRRTTFSVVFFCKKTKINKKGKAPVYARITTSGQATEIYTQCQVEPEHWNQRLERYVLRDAVSMRINGIIASYRANILAAYVISPLFHTAIALSAYELNIAIYAFAIKQFGIPVYNIPLVGYFISTLFECRIIRNPI